MFPVLSVGPSELAILGAVTALACGLPLIGAIVVAVFVLRHEGVYLAEQE